jgi:hypothetical protein
MRRRKQSKQQEQQKKHKTPSLNSLSNWVDLEAWRGFYLLDVSWSECFCSCIECGVQKTWIALNGGGWRVFIAPTTILVIAVCGTPDSLVVHRTWHCSLSGVCHVSRPLGFGAVDRWSPLSSCDTEQFDAFWLRGSDFWLAHSSLLLYTTVDRWAQLIVAPLAHRTCLVHTGQSGEF